MLGLDFHDLLREGLFVEAKTKNVSKITESALHTVGYGFLLRLGKLLCYEARVDAAQLALSNAAPLLFKFSAVPYPTSS